MKSNAEIAIRCDYSPLIGSGHFFRCLTLANKFEELGKRVVFASANPDPRSIFSVDFPYAWVQLKSDTVTPNIVDDCSHAHFRVFTQEQDAALFADAFTGSYFEWIIVDHYGLDRKWHEACRSLTSGICVIDDLADRHHDCDILIDQTRVGASINIYADKVPSHCKMCIGPQYALLQPEYSKRHSSRHIRKKVKHVLIFFGGADLKGMTKKCIEVINDPLFDDIKFTVITGALSAHTFESMTKPNITIEHHVRDIVALLDEVDIAIGSCGTHSFERACLGVPAICIPVAENQFNIYAMLKSLGAILAVDYDCPNAIGQIKNHLSVLIENPSLIEKISSKAYDLTDGYGVEKITNMMNTLSAEKTLK